MTGTIISSATYLNDRKAALEMLSAALPLCILAILVLCYRNRLLAALANGRAPIPIVKNSLPAPPKTSLLPGPPIRYSLNSLVWGHVSERNDAASGGPLHVETRWAKEYGPLYRYKGFFGSDRIVVADSRALHHILRAQTSVFPKPKSTRRVIEHLLGRGMITAEGVEHKRQRVALEPLFSVAAVRKHYESIDRHARILADSLLVQTSQAQDAQHLQQQDPSQLFPAAPRFSRATRAKIQRCLLDSQLQQSAPQEGGLGHVVDILHWASACNLDMLGSSIFGQHFSSVPEDADGEVNPLVKRMHQAVVDVENKCSSIGAWELLGVELSGSVLPSSMPPKLFPVLKAAAALRSVVSELAKGVLERMKLEQPVDDDVPVSAQKGRTSGRRSAAGNHGFLQRLINSKGEEKLSDDDIIEQLVTLIIVGHEVSIFSSVLKTFVDADLSCPLQTTSISLAWTLLCLSQHPDLQDRIRTELKDLASEDLSEEARIEAILHAPYLEKIVREALRLYTPVPVTRREAECDTVIPIGGDGILLRNGQRTNQVVVPKGSLLAIHSWALHRDPEIWGDDADQFDPDRKQPAQLGSGAESDAEGLLKEKSKLGDGLTYMPFLVGSRSCVGQRFAMAQVSTL